MDKKILLEPRRAEEKYALIIPEEVENKIRHLCNRIYSVEWSGILFYSSQGNFEDGSLVLTCKDIYVMDIGSSAFTEFDMAPEVMTYAVENNLLDYQQGLIHSHNNMATFFSATDISTLKEEGNDRNHFLSLIVNNAGVYTAAITRKIQSTRTVKDCYSYETFDGLRVEDCIDETEEPIEELQYFYLDITKEGNACNYEEIDKRLDEIREAKKKAPTKFDKKDTVYNYNGTTSSYKTFNFKDDYKIDELRPPMPVKVTPEDDMDTLAKSLAMQLLTGSVMITADSNIDMHKYVKGLDSVVRRRFGEGEKGLKEYENFIDFMAETIVYGAVSKDEEVMPLVEKMYSYIMTMPKNEYVNICLDKLTLLL